MASPLDNINSIPPSAIYDQRPHPLAFGRPVQAHDTTAKQLPSPDSVLIHPLPAAPKKREEIFVRACQAGNEAQVQHLLNAAPSLTACDNYRELLSDAIMKGEGGVVDLLLAFKKNDPEDQQFFLNVAIGDAVYEGHVAILKSLLNRQRKCKWVELLNSGHLHVAVSLGHGEIAALLVEAGSNINAKSDLLSGTPLTYAAQHGHRLMVRRLLELGADPNRRPDNTGPTPLAWACYAGDLSVVKMLLEAGALVDRGERDSYTPLAVAVNYGREEIVDHLLLCGADVNAAFEPRQAPLYRAVINNRRQLLDVLLQAKAAADLLCEQEVEETPLMAAVRLGHYSYAELLVDHGADLHKTGAEGFSALELAVRGGVNRSRIAVMLHEKAAQQAPRPGAQPQRAEQ